MRLTMLCAIVLGGCHLLIAHQGPGTSPELGTSDGRPPELALDRGGSEPADGRPADGKPADGRPADGSQRADGSLTNCSTCPAGTKCVGGTCCAGCENGGQCVTSPTAQLCGTAGAPCKQCPQPKSVCETVSCNTGTGTCVSSTVDNLSCPGGKCAGGTCCTTCISASTKKCEPLSNSTCGKNGASCEDCAFSFYGACGTRVCGASGSCELQTPAPDGVFCFGGLAGRCLTDATGQQSCCTGCWDQVKLICVHPVTQSNLRCGTAGEDCKACGMVACVGGYCL